MPTVLFESVFFFRKLESAAMLAIVLQRKNNSVLDGLKGKFGRMLLANNKNQPILDLFVIIIMLKPKISGSDKLNLVLAFHY